MRAFTFAFLLLAGVASATRAQTTFDSDPKVRGILAEAVQTAGQVFGLYGVTASPDAGSSGLLAESTAARGVVFGLVGTSASADGAAGFFTSLGGGPILRGVANGVTVFEVSAAGEVTAGLLFGDGMGLGALGDIDCDDCISGGHLADGSVVATKLAPNAVGADELAAGAVTAADLGLHVVQTHHLAAGSVGNAVIAAGSVGGVDIGLRALGASALAPGAVSAEELAADAVRRSHISGSERLLYAVHQGCLDTDVLVFQSTCETPLCGLGQFLDCAGACSRTTPEVCLNEEFGYLLGADIDAF